MDATLHGTGAISWAAFWQSCRKPQINFDEDAEATASATDDTEGEQPAPLPPMVKRMLPVLMTYSKFFDDNESPGANLGPVLSTTCILTLMSWGCLYCGLHTIPGYKTIIHSLTSSKMVISLHHFQKTDSALYHCGYPAKQPIITITGLGAR